MDEEFTDQAKTIVNLVRSFKVEHKEAVSLVAQALKMAHSEGSLKGAKEAYAISDRAFDAAMDAVIGVPRDAQAKSSGTAQTMLAEMCGGDTSQPLFD